LSSFISAGIDLSYYPASTVKVEFLDTLKYGMTVIPFRYTENIKKEIFFINFDINLKFAHFLSQNWAVSFGGFMGTWFKYGTEFVLRQYATLDLFDTVSVSSDYQPYGLTGDVSVLSPILKRFGFQFKMRLYYLLQSTMRENKGNKVLVTWHAGMSYQL